MKEVSVLVKEKQTIVTINGQQFFTADWVMAQFSKQMASIDRANRIAAGAMVVAILSIILSAAL